MSVSARQIQSTTIIFCVFQVVLLVVGSLGYYMLSYRIRHFDYGKMQLDKERIIQAVKHATVNFLYDYQTNLESQVKVEKNNVFDSPEVVELNGVACSTLRSLFVRIGRVDYYRGDFLPYGTNLYEIVGIDFDRQRLYGIGKTGGVLIGCLVGLDSTFAKGDEISSADGRNAPGRRFNGGEARSGRRESDFPL